MSEPEAGFWLLGKVLKEATVALGVKEVGEKACIYLVDFSYMSRRRAKNIPTKQWFSP